MRVIIVGAGKIGSVLARHLADRSHDVTLVEKDQRWAGDLAQELAKVTVIAGDATERNILEEAGGAEADALVSVASDSATNLLVALLAQTVGIKHIIARAHNEEFERVFRGVGINNVLLPEQSVAEHLEAMIVQPNVYDLTMLHREVDLYEYELPADSPLAGEIYSLGMTPPDSLIVAIRRDNEFIIPVKNTYFQAGDKVVVIAKQSALPALKKKFRQ